MNFFKNIQNKSYEWKKRFARILTIVIIFIIFVFWLGFILPKNIDKVGSVKTDTKVFRDINEPLQTFGQELGNIWGEFKDKFKRSTTTTSTTSSSTDLVQ